MALEGHLGFVHQVHFDTTGRLLYSASIEGSIAVWDVQARALRGRFDVHEGPVNGLRLDGDSIASVGHDGYLRISRANGSIAQQFDLGEPLHALAWDGGAKVVGGRNGALHIVEDDAIRTIAAAQDAVEAVAIAGDRIIAGSRDGTIAVISALTGELTCRFEGHEDWVTRVAVWDEAHVISVGEDGRLIVWNIESQRERWRLDIGAPIWGLAVDRKAQRAYVGPGGTPRIVDMRTREIRTIDGLVGFAARAIDVSPNGVVCLGDDSGSIHFVAPAETEVAWTIPGRHRGVLTASAIDAGVVTGHQDGSVELVGARLTRRVTAHGPMAYASTNIDRGRFATAAFDGSIQVWDETFTPRLTFDHGGHVFALGFSSARGVLLSAGEDRWIEWDVLTGQQVHVERDIGTDVHTLADIDPSGRIVVAVGENARVMVWRERRSIASWPLPYQDSSAIRLLPDDGGVLVAFNDGVVGSMSLDGGDFEELHREHDSWVRQLLVTDDARYVVSSSQNGIAVVFDRRSSRTRRLTADPVAAIALRDDRTVAVVSAQGGVVDVELGSGYL